MPTDEPSDLAQVARELYALVPAEFVAARNARAARLRQDRQRELATEVKRLPKASAAAWAVSAVVGEAGEDVDALGELGAELRVAQRLANPAELRALARRRRDQVAALTRVAARLAAEQEVELSAAALGQVSDTWQAMVIDSLAERVGRSGLLVRPLEPGDEEPRCALALPDAVTEPAERAPGGPLLRLAPPAAADDEDAGEDEAPDDEADDEAPEESGEDDETGDEEDEADEGDGEGDDTADSEPGTTDGSQESETGDADDLVESHVRGGIRIRRARSARPREPASGTAREPRDARATARNTRATSATRAGTAGARPTTGRAAGEDPAREERRLRRELGSRERIVAGLQGELEEASEELSRVEAQVLQVAVQLEELRREVLGAEERLAELDDARLVAREEKEDAQDRVRVAEAELSRVRDRLADLDDG